MRVEHELCDDFLLMLIDKVIEIEGLCAAKQLRSMERVSRVFAHAARSHPDNQIPPPVSVYVPI